MPQMLPLLVCALLSTVEAAAPAELGGTSEEPTATAHSGGLDVSNFLVVLIAVGLISYCALRAVTPAAQSSSVMAGPPDPAHGVASFAPFSADRVRVLTSTRQRRVRRAVQEAGEMQLWSTVAFVVVASLALVLIFFFMKVLSLRVC